jgi:hypothetical protein
MVFAPFGYCGEFFWMRRRIRWGFPARYSTAASIDDWWLVFDDRNPVWITEINHALRKR